MKELLREINFGFIKNELIPPIIIDESSIGELKELVEAGYSIDDDICDELHTLAINL